MAAPQTKDKLISAAIGSMLERGYSATTVDTICKRAGTTKGAFFHYFRSKEDIGLAGLERYAETIFERFDQSARGDTAVARLRNYLADCADIGFEVERPPVCLIAVQTLELASVNEAFRERCEAHLSKWHGLIEQLLTDAFSEAQSSADATSYAEHFLSVFEGAIILARANQDPSVIKRTVAQFQKFLDAALGGTPLAA